MASPTYTLAAAASADLEEIVSYIEKRDGPLRSAAIAAKVDRGLASLAFMPNVGRRVKAEGSPRRYNIGPWGVLFEPASYGIHVLRIYDGRRDLQKLFREYRRPTRKSRNKK